MTASRRARRQRVWCDRQHALQHAIIVAPSRVLRWPKLRLCALLAAVARGRPTGTEHGKRWIIL